MGPAWKVAVIALWAAAIVQLLLTLRGGRWLREFEQSRRRSMQRHRVPPLLAGSPAPDFNAMTLAGEQVRSADYAGRKVAFVFVSPQCGVCRHELPMLNRLGKLAAQRAGVEITLVTEAGESETRGWLQRVREEDGVEVALPVLVAPASISNLIAAYNPGGIFPSYCFVENGTVRATDALGAGEWPQLQRDWTAPQTPASARPAPSRAGHP